MAKYGANVLGDYDKLWSPNDRRFLQTFIDNSALLQVKYGFIYEHFDKDVMPTVTQASGEATFMVAAVKRQVSEMADFKAPLAANVQMDKDGFTSYTGTIPDMGKGFQENASERYQKELMFKDVFGADANLISQYVDDVQKYKDSIDSRLSWMGARLMTTGAIEGANVSGGVNYFRQNNIIPTENFITAGANAWTDSSCDLIAQMQKIEQDYFDAHGDDQLMEWNIPLAMWRNVFLKNASIIAAIKSWRSDNNLATSSVIDEAWLNDYLNALGIISPIKVIQEGEVGATLSSRTNVKGWDNKIAVFKPRGKAGIIKYTIPLAGAFAEKYKSPSVERVKAELQGGLITLVNSVIDNGGYPEWHTDLYCSATPALTEFPYHIIVDTSTADAGTGS